MKTKTPKSELDLPIVAGLLEGNRVPVEMLATGLMVLAPKWPGPDSSPESPHKLQVLWNDTPAGNAEFTAPGAYDPDANRTLRVNPPHLVEGSHLLSYSVTIGNDPLQKSKVMTIIIDTTEPVLGTPNALIFPLEVIQNGITKAWLEANGNKVTADLPAYTEPHIGDVITAYWDAADDDDTVIVQRTLTTNDYNQPLTLEFPGDAILDHGAGSWKVRYRVKDLVGNPSGYSDYVTLQFKDEPVSELLAPPQFRTEDIADPKDHTLFKDVVNAGQGLTVLIPAWDLLPIIGTTDRVWLEFAPGDTPLEEDYVDITVLDVPGPIAPGDFPLTIMLPDARLRPDGPFCVRYRVISWNDAVIWSSPVSLISDTTPPFGDAEPPKPTVPPNPITDAYLDLNPAGVPCVLERYPNWQAGDRVTFWWVGGGTPPDDPTELEPAGTEQVMLLPFTFTVPADVVRATGDGGCFLIYMVTDKATNRSRLSVYSPVDVALGALPDNLKDPLVPAAADGTVGLADAHEGVVVQIPQFDNWKPTDRVEVRWGDTVLADELIGSAPAWPVSIRVPTETLAAEYGSHQGPKDTTVIYRIMRGGVGSIGKQINFHVDLSVIGPALPDWPDPNNPDLTAAAIYGDSGMLNELAPADNGKNVRVDITLYAPLNVDEEIHVYWDEKRVNEAPYIVKATDAPGDVVSITVPWSYVEDAGNAADLPVTYSIRGPGSVNYQMAPPTQVKVEAVVLIPDAPVFLKLSTGGFLNCDSLDGVDNAVLVQVPDLSMYLADGDTVDVHWVALSGMDGETILDDTRKHDTLTLGAEYPVTGFEWRVTPFEKHVAPTFDPDNSSPAGRARIHYTFLYRGQLATSPVTEAIVGMFYGNGQSCDLNRDGGP